jgi:hypothetical protein
LLNALIQMDRVLVDMIRFGACFERLIGVSRRHQGIKTTP